VTVTTLSSSAPSDDASAARGPPMQQAQETASQRRCHRRLGGVPQRDRHNEPTLLQSNAVADLNRATASVRMWLHCGPTAGSAG
jgi:hypothetical protein